MPANRFDFIRLVLAACVFAYHGVAIGALQPLGDVEQALARLAEIAIQSFFIVSGLLVAGSLERSSTLADYAGKRFRRLYPAYAAVILLPAALSYLLTQDAAGAASYLAANLSFMNFLAPDLPGLFEDNRFREANGALWTLKIEVMFYLVLPAVLAALSRMRSVWWAGIALMYLAGETWAYLLPHLVEGGLGMALARQLPGQMAFFAMGIALWKVRVRASAHWAVLGAAGAALLAASLAVPELASLRALGLAGLIAAIAWAPGPKPNAAQFGDLSYGVYITHFPILQALAAVGLGAQLGLAVFMALATTLVILASLLLWHLVEKPALRPSSHYRRVAESD